MKLTKAIIFASMFAFSGAAFAQGAAAPAPAPTTPATAPAKPAKAMKPRTAKSLECSKKANEQKLHGKARKHFMSKCKKS